MSRLVRLAVLWLIASALPLQGIAAASMLGCAAGHHGVPPARHASAAAAAPSAHHAPYAAAEHDSAHGKAGCGVCAACCVGMGLTAAPIRVPAPPAHAGSLRAADETPRPGCAARTLERPPRTDLA